MKSSTRPPLLKTAIVLGATGLIGSELVKLLQASPHYDTLVLLNRRPSGYRQSKVVERLIDFAAPDLDGLTGGDFYCAFGTTRRQAGSEAGQAKVDYDYPAQIATRLRAQGVSRIALVSSIGADAKAANFYLRTKGRLEETILGLGFAQTVIVRPSFLIGRRAEFRRGERAAIFLMKLFSPLMRGPLRKYQAIEASVVARRLVEATNSGAMGVQFIESDKIRGGA